ncbi:MAG TPA: cellulase family glycosylhydrolase [Thermomicrobiaceae bacterium]|nr:cellulase family glycosylhydrolase [Thermomicrobiaceae bacterium]
MNTVTAGHVLIASVDVPNGYEEQGAPTSQGPADLSWTQAIRTTIVGSQITVWYAAVWTSGSYAITATANGYTPGLAVDEYAGIATTDAVVAKGSDGGTSWTPHARTTTSAPANALVYANFTWNTVKANPAPTKGYTMRQLFADATMTAPVVVEDQVLGAAGTPKPSISLPRKDGWAAVVVAFAANGHTTPPPLPTTGAVSGTVKSSSGTALDGATVTIGSLKATTDSGGSYTLANAPAGSDSVTASADGYTSASQTVTVAAGTTSSADFHLSPVSSTNPGDGLHVSGNTLLDAQGQPVILRGVDRAGAEYACIQNWGIFDNNIDVMNDDAVIATMPAWKINSVNIGLNEDCWLGINGVKSTYGGTAYQQAIIHDVQTIESYGMIPVLALHWSAPGRIAATDQWPMPDADHSPAFWQSVANTFKNDPNVIFRLKEEPYPNGNSDDAQAWKCWRDGGSACTDGYAEVGMQSLINTIRATGAKNVIAVPGIQYANSLTQFLTYQPSDPLNNLMAVVDVYPHGNICGTTACYDANYAPVAAAMPLFAGEFGESVDGNICGVTASNTLMQWFDAHQAGYMAWVYDPWGTGCGNLSLITDDSGTPKSPNGTNYKQHLAAVQP